MKNFLFIIAILFSSTIFSQILDCTVEQATGFVTPQRGIKNISIVDENIVWALAYDGSGNNENVQEFTKTINGGDLWIPGTIDLGNSELGIGMITAVSNNIAWVVAYPIVAGQIGGVFKTIDGGTTWFRQNTALFNLSGSFPNVVHFWDENKGFCRGDPVDGYFEIYTTTDGGTNWNRVPSTDIPTPESGEYGLVGKITITDDTLWFSTNRYVLYRSFDFGHTFQMYSFPFEFEGPPAFDYSFSFSDDNNGYQISKDGTFWKSSDGGETWQIQFPVTGSSFGGHIFALPNTDVVYTSNTDWSAYPGVSYSVDGGMNWVIEEELENISITDIQLRGTPTTSIYGWFGSFNTSDTEGGIYYHYFKPCASVSNHALKQATITNPITDSCTIKAPNDINKISIFNIFGKHLNTYYPKSSFFTFDTSFYSEPVYIFKISIGTRTEFHKVVKL